MNGGTPPEPPVGTVLEARDDIDVYRIERLPDGWAIQYRDGENEYGARHTSGRISWPSAWRAWGPPTTGTPFTQVRPGTPPLPPHLPEPVPLFMTAPDASSDTLPMPPPARPHQPRRSPTTAEGRRRPAAPPTATSPGASMSGSIGDAAAGIRGSNDTASEANGILGQAISHVEEARGRLQAAVAGSPQADVGDALGLYARAIETIQDAQKAVAAAQAAADSVAARL